MKAAFRFKGDLLDDENDLVNRFGTAWPLSPSSFFVSALALAKKY
jgi:hypothetical protein